MIPTRAQTPLEEFGLYLVGDKDLLKGFRKGVEVGSDLGFWRPSGAGRKQGCGAGSRESIAMVQGGEDAGLNGTE